MPIRQNLKLFNYIGKLLSEDPSSLSSFQKASEKPQWQERSPSILLPRSMPEAQNVSSEHIAHLFQKASENSSIHPHSMMVLRHGHVIAEAGYAPFSTKIWHVTHSLCKSVTALAVGFAIQENLFSLDDFLFNLFPEKFGMFSSKRMRALTVRHLLTMTSGVTFREVGVLVESDWENAYFDAEIAYEPGSTFDYNSMNSYILSCLIQRKTGQTLTEFLKPRLFDPLEMGDVAWEKSPTGVEKGGWGMYLYPEDMAKLGQFLLQKGAWVISGEKKNLLSSQWIEEMTSTSVDSTSKADQGYGYHIWTDPKRNAFYLSGLFGQRVYVDPLTDSVIVLTAGNASMLIGEEMTSLFRWYLENLSDKEISVSSESMEDLPLYLKSLQFMKPSSYPPTKDVIPAPKLSWIQKLLTRFKKEEKILPPTSSLPSETEKILDKTYVFPPNRAGLLPFVIQCMDGNYTHGIESISFSHLNDQAILLSWKEGGIDNSFPLSFDSSYFQTSIQIGEEFFEIAASGCFSSDEDDHLVLKIRLCFLENSNLREIKIFFLENDQIRIQLRESPEIVFELEKVIEKTGLLNRLSFLNHSKGYTRFLVHSLGWPEATGSLDLPDPNLDTSEEILSDLEPIESVEK